MFMKGTYVPPHLAVWGCGYRAVVIPVCVHTTELEGHFSQALVHFFLSRAKPGVPEAKSHGTGHWRRVSRPHAHVTVGLSAECMANIETRGVLAAGGGGNAEVRRGSHLSKLRKGVAAVPSTVFLSTQRSVL